MYSSRGSQSQQSASEVTQAARVRVTTPYSPIGFFLNVPATLEEVNCSHAALAINADTTALELAAAGQTLDA